MNPVNPVNSVNTNNYVGYNQNANFQPYQVTQYFPQPQGSIYMIGSSNDVANVPVGTGVSAAICLREGLIYLKTIQNGSPMLLGYKLSPLEGNTIVQEQKTQNQQAAVPQTPNSAQEPNLEQRILTALEDFESRLKKIEGSVKSKGGTDKWQL